jgi:hypothetical protein
MARLAEKLRGAAQRQKQRFTRAALFSHELHRVEPGAAHAEDDLHGASFECGDVTTLVRPLDGGS